MTPETWRAVVGIPGYEVSDQGRVRALPRAVGVVGSVRTTEYVRHQKMRVLQAQQTVNGRLGVRIPTYASIRTVGKLVMEAFVGPCPPKRCVQYRNGVVSDNRLENLFYGAQLRPCRQRRFDD